MHRIRQSRQQDLNDDTGLNKIGSVNNDNKTNTAHNNTTVEQKKYGNPTVDSILSKYTLVPMPSPVTTEQIFPVIGQYQSSTNADQKLTITLDDQNKGFAWIDGMPQGRVKAVLKKSPATYKIPAQKTDAAKMYRKEP